MTEEKKNITLKSLQKETNDQAAEFDDRLSAVEHSIQEVDTTIKNLGDDIEQKFSRVLDAINRPASIRKDGREADDAYLHEDEGEIKFSDGRPEDDVQMVETVKYDPRSAEFKSKAEQLAFDREMVKIMVHSSTSNYADNTFSIGVNGVLRCIKRGQEQWVPRAYVEVLLRAKTSNYGNNEIINQQTGLLEVKNPETKALRYPCQIVEDKNPLGAAWLERVVNDRAA